MFNSNIERISYGKSTFTLYWRIYKINGLFDILIETSTFWVKTAKEVAGGTHYERSFHGMLILLEALRKLKWNAFREKTDKDIFRNFVTKFKGFQNGIKKIKKR